MKKNLTKREEEVMELFWREGPLFVKELIPFFDEPKPHINTLSTIVRGLEEKGYITHKVYGNTFQYYAAVSKSEYGRIWPVKRHTKIYWCNLGFKKCNPQRHCSHTNYWAYP